MSHTQTSKQHRWAAAGRQSAASMASCPDRRERVESGGNPQPFVPMYRGIEHWAIEAAGTLGVPRVSLQNALRAMIQGLPD